MTAIRDLWEDHAVDDGYLEGDKQWPKTWKHK